MIAAPLALLVGAAIILETPGPVIYRAQRVGLRGRRFDMLKFRKMAVDAGGRRLAFSDDARFTRVGRFLARTKLDELPQFWNVLRGDMSVVGPRPEDPSFVAEAPQAFEQALQVRPGITGLAQLEYADEGSLLDRRDPLGHYRSKILPRKLALDSLYVKRASILLDLRVLWYTAITVVGRQQILVDRMTGRPRRASTVGAER
jgi:lipopolysaccharide/colanic/teichoic acid biosynthesis glycosyltransferase